MTRERVALLRALAVTADGAVISFTYLAVLAARIGLTEALALPPLGFAEHVSLLWLLVPMWLLALGWLAPYRGVRFLRPDRLLGGVLRASGAALLGTIVVLYGLHAAGGVSRTLLFGFAASTVPALWATRRGGAALARRWLEGVPSTRALLVGEAIGLAPAADAIARHPEWGWQVVARLEPDAVDDLEQHLHGVDQVIVGHGLDPDTLRRVVAACEARGVRLGIDATFLGVRTAAAKVEDLDGWAMLTLSTTPEHAEALLVKRALDIALAAIGLLLLAPVMAVVALWIRRDGGPALFVQERVGLHGRRFTLYKLRSMVPDAESHRDALLPLNEMSGPVFKLRTDPRVTRIGAWLRRTSLDEAPQLFNVLRGDMSLVGPRPPLPEEVARYAPWQWRRLSVRPGLTCTWQVSGRSDVDFDRWVDLDLAYIDAWSLRGDLLLLLRTIPAVLRGTGAR